MISGSRDGRAPEPPIDLSRLRPEERELWDEFFGGPLGSTDGWAIRIWSFGYACTLELWGSPPVVTEYLDQVDPDNTIQQYLDNVRRAYDEGRL
jgi:hypothetical protein